ncbi:hypothetical protein SLEP1_g57213 [Rubroshorea leprosula]|uniref:Uncharacterized protein n=1 Tax=Rubroshorea leprosula TaxID=152421 RepID=A0AAV5ML14_9ROSI|nr:hypothetical protein SLEP1_g57213 [Rubroshorea leprosula]
MDIYTGIYIRSKTNQAAATSTLIYRFLQMKIRRGGKSDASLLYNWHLREEGRGKTLEGSIR